MNTTANAVSDQGHTLGPIKKHNNMLSIDKKMDRAVARIEASRSALVVCLAPDPPKQRSKIASAADGNAAEDGDVNLSWIKTLKARVERNGLLQGSWRTARTLARRWWTRQSWHSSVDLVVETLAHEAKPLMRRHPLTTLAAGAAFGAGLVTVAFFVHPWASHRMRGSSVTWSGRVGNLLWSQFSSTPVQMALAGALTAWVADQRARQKAQAQAPSNAATTPVGDAIDRKTQNIRQTSHL